MDLLSRCYWICFGQLNPRNFVSPLFAFVLLFLLMVLQGFQTVDNVQIISHRIQI